MSKKESSQETALNLGRRVFDSLTQEQVQTLLDALFSTRDTSHDEALFRRLDEDIAHTIQKILQTEGQPESGVSDSDRIISRQRLLEEWDALWKEWDQCVRELGREKGKYVGRAEHWEPPNFYGDDLAYDLDKIAEKMRPLIDDVFVLVKEPDLFKGAIRQIDERIGLYPEWLGADYRDPFQLGANTTDCILRWQWLQYREHSEPGENFLEDIHQIEILADRFRLNQAACTPFFDQLPEAVCREIYELFTGGGTDEWWHEDLDCAYSKWHHIHHLYEKRFNPAAYLKTCRTYLAENWKYGRPLVEDAIGRKAYSEAENLLVRTFYSYLRLEEPSTWYPESSLLLEERCSFYPPENKEKVIALLGLWARAAEKQNNQARAAACRLQQVTVESPENWHQVMETYKHVRNPRTRDTIDPLFKQWQALSVRRGVDTYRDIPSSDTWFHWLMATQIDDACDKHWFRGKVMGWLQQLNAESKNFIEEAPLLACFTKDLANSSVLKKEYPTFYEGVLPDDKSQASTPNSRRELLEQMGNAERFLPAVMEVWHHHLHHLVPDPANSHRSRYGTHARWMVALREINREAHARLLAEWRINHKRRSSLWKALEESHSQS
jgi:hypothetical protein